MARPRAPLWPAAVRSCSVSPSPALLAASCAAFAAGQTAWTWSQSVGATDVPFPSLADVGFVAQMPLMAGALLAFAGRRPRRPVPPASGRRWPPRRRLGAAPRRGLRPELTTLGVPLAIDDFGTGYSSLLYLARFPFDVIKIDRNFVSTLTTSPETLAVVSAVVELADTLGRAVVAEGVETTDQLAGLCELSGQAAQELPVEQAGARRPGENTARREESVGGVDGPRRSWTVDPGGV